MYPHPQFLVALAGAIEGGNPTPPFKLIAHRGRRLPLITLVPHASIALPRDMRKTIVLSDSDPRREVVRLTD